MSERILFCSEKKIILIEFSEVFKGCREKKVPLNVISTSLILSLELSTLKYLARTK